MNSLFLSQAQRQAVTHGKTCEHSGAVCPTALSDMACVEQELDRCVAELGQAMLKAQADGDPQGARIYHDRQLAAIRSRTPEHQARLAAEVERRIDEGMDFFAHQGQLDRERLGRNA